MKNTLNEIKSLMSRMEELPNGKTGFLTEGSLGRLNFEGDIQDFFNTIEIGKGFWVSLGYIQKYDLDKIYPEKSRGSFEQQLAGLDKDSRIYGKMGKFMGSAEFNDPTGRAYKGFKSMASQDVFDSVLMTGSYSFNWGDVNSLKNFYEKQREEEMGIRKKYGFGDDESAYPEDDWRRKPEYGGLGLMKAGGGKRTNPDGSDVRAPYSNIANPDINLYKDNDTYGNDRMSQRKNGEEYQKMALKFGLNDVKKQWKTYYLIDKNGEIDDVADNLARLFSKPGSGSKKFDIEGMADGDELNFRKEMNAFLQKQDRSTKNWLIDNVAYIVATGRDRITGETLQGARWINRNIREMFPDTINDEEFTQILNNCISKSTSDLTDAINQSDKQY